MAKKSNENPLLDYLPKGSSANKGTSSGASNGNTTVVQPTSSNPLLDYVPGGSSSNYQLNFNPRDYTDVQSWANTAKSLFNRYNTMSKNWNDDIEYSIYDKQRATLLEQGMTLRKQYNNDMDAFTYINDIIGNLSRAESTPIRDYFGQFKDADEFNEYKAAKEFDDKMRSTYGGQNYDQLQSVLSGMDSSSDEYKWLNNYATSDEVMTIADYDKVIADLESRVKEAESRYRPNYNGLFGNEVGEEVQNLRAELENYKNARWRAQNKDKYSGLSDNADYAEKSKVIDSSLGNTYGVSIGGKWYGSGDDVYAYINNLGGRGNEYNPDRKSASYAKYDLMTDEQRDNYNYLYQTQGKEAADKYLEYISYYLNAEHAGNMSQQWKNIAEEYPVASSLFSVPANLISGTGLIGATLQGIGRDISGEWKPIDYYGAASNPGIVSQTIRGTIASNITDEFGDVIKIDAKAHPYLAKIFNGRSWGNVYQLGMSVADSLSIAYGMGPIGTLLLGGSAGTQGMLQALDKGASDSQAIAMGILNGAFESLFEFVSLDHLLKMNGTGIKAFLRNTVLQGLVEGDEELNTTLFNTIGDIIVMAQNSDWERAKAEYISNGMTVEEASRQVLIDTAINMGWDFIGGLLSAVPTTMVQTAVSSVAGDVRERNYYRDTYGSSINELVNEAREINPTSSTVSKVQSRLNNNQKISGKDIRNLVRENDKTLTNNDKSKINSAVKERLTTYGEEGDVSALASAITKRVAGEDLTKAEKKLINNSKYAQRVLNELDPENIRSGEYNTEWAQKLGTEKINVEEYSRLIEELDETEEAPAAEEQEAQKTTPTPDAAKENVTKPSEGETKAEADTSSEVDNYEDVITPGEDNGIKFGQPASHQTTPALIDIMNGKVTVSGITAEQAKSELDRRRVFDQEKKDNVKTAPTQTKAAPKTETNSGTTIEEEAKAYGNQAGAFTHTYNHDQDVEDYAEAYKQAFEYGAASVPFESIKNLDGLSYLTETQRELAYKAGQDSQKTKAETEDAANKSGRKNDGSTWKVGSVKYNAEYKGEKINKGGIVKGENVSVKDIEKAFNDKQKIAYKVLTRIAQATGINIVLYSSEADADNVFRGVQGMFRRSTPDTIYIDINAGIANVKDMSDAAKYTMLYSFSHEFVHFVEKWNPVRYNELRKVIFEQMTENGADVDALISTKAEDQGLEYERASREVVAESLTQILEQQTFVEKLYNEHKNLFQKLLEKLQEFIDNIKAYFKDANTVRNRDAAALMQTIDGAVKYTENVAKLFNEVAKEAVDNYQMSLPNLEPTVENDFDGYTYVEYGKWLFSQQFNNINSKAQKLLDDNWDNYAKLLENGAKIGPLMKRFERDFKKAYPGESMWDKEKPKTSEVGRERFAPNDFTSTEERGESLVDKVEKVKAKEEIKTEEVKPEETEKELSIVDGWKNELDELMAKPLPDTLEARLAEVMEWFKKKDNQLRFEYVAKRIHSQTTEQLKEFFEYIETIDNWEHEGDVQPYYLYAHEFAKNEYLRRTKDNVIAETEAVPVAKPETVEPVKNKYGFIVRDNEKSNGTEIGFDSIPPVNVREVLKKNGFKWNSKRKVWYSKKTDNQKITEELERAYAETETTPEEKPVEKPFSGTEIYNPEAVEQLVSDKADGKATPAAEAVDSMPKAQENKPEQVQINDGKPHTKAEFVKAVKYTGITDIGNGYEVERVSDHFVIRRIDTKEVVFRNEADSSEYAFSHQAKAAIVEEAWLNGYISISDSAVTVDEQKRELILSEVFDKGNFHDFAEKEYNKRNENTFGDVIIDGVYKDFGNYDLSSKVMLLLNKRGITGGSNATGFAVFPVDASSFAIARRERAYRKDVVSTAYDIIGKIFRNISDITGTARAEISTANHMMAFYLSNYSPKGRSGKANFAVLVSSFEQACALYNSICDVCGKQLSFTYNTSSAITNADISFVTDSSRYDNVTIYDYSDVRTYQPGDATRKSEAVNKEKGKENNGEEIDIGRTVLGTESDGEGTSRLLDESEAEPVQGDVGTGESDGSPAERGRQAERDGNQQSVEPGRSGSERTGESGDLRGNDVSAEEEAKHEETIREEVDKEIEQKSTTQPKGNNFVFGESLNLPTGAKSRFKANVEAIRLIKKLETEGRYATAEEQIILSKYVGWGGLSEAFGEYKYNYATRKAEFFAKNGWESEFEELKSLVNDGLISEEEYSGMSASTKNAHYTSAEVIKAMYSGLEQLGFKGGRMLEPSSGVGNFVGGMPVNMSKTVNSWTLVELDRITGTIAKYLYPNADIRIQGFEKANIPNNYMDVAIGNVPFGDYGVVDKTYPKRVTSTIHNYFFAKALDKVRPGGIVMFITSSFTLNGRDTALRQYIMDRADLVGAIRLPNTAFQGNAGTQVVTDILVLKKREAGTEYAGESFLNSPHTKVESASSSNYDWFYINEYFNEHPEMVLGTADMVRGMYGPESLTYKPLEGKGTLGEQITEAFKNISAKMEYKAQATPEKSNFTQQKAGKKTKNGGLEVKEGKVYRNQDGNLVEVEADAKSVERITALLGIRDAYRNLANYQLQGLTEAEIKKARKELNTLYDKFVEKYGFINDPKNRKAIESDPDSYSLLALENYDPTKKSATKADIFSKNTISPNKTITHVDSVSEGVIVSVNSKGTIEPAYIASLTGKTVETVTRELIDGRFAFKTRDGSLESPDKYLSGNVRAKLREAESLAPLDRDFENNVEELKKVIPADIPFNEIYTSIGTPWVPNEVYADFIAYMLGGSNASSYRGPDVIVGRTSQGEFKIVLNNPRLKHQYRNIQEYGTSRRTFLKIMEIVMNSGDLTVKDPVESDSGKTTYVVNKVETAAVQEKSEAITKEFQEWLWKDENRRNELSSLYNETFNAFVTPRFSGEHLTVNGINPNFSLRPHQADAVQRIVSSGGNTLLAHKVGAGKTLEMATAAMKLRELGIVKKPMFAVPKSLVAQWGIEFKNYFPAAKLLVADDKSFSKANRKVFENRIANGDYDAVIVSYEQFGLIPMSAEFQTKFYQEQINEILTAIAEEKAESRDGRGLTVKEMEKRKAQLEKKISELNSAAKDEDNIDFEQLGVDSLFVDEAHNFKNLFYTTRMKNIAGLGNPAGVKRTFDLYTKVRYLQGLNGGRGIVFATATPVMNSMSEMYIMQKYLQSDILEQLGLKSFDAWAKQFGEIVNAVEIKPSGQGFRVKQSFSNFRNLNELQMLFRSFSDVLTDVPGLKIPKLRGGQVNTIVCEPGAFQLEYMKSLEKRADNIKNVSPKDDNMLKITSDGRKVSYTQRMIDPSLPYETGCKIYRCCEKVIEEYKASTNKTVTDPKTGKQIKLLGTQIIFCDMATPKGTDAKKTKETEDTNTDDGELDVESAKLYDDIRDYLIKNGIPAAEIAFIHEADTDAKKKKLFADVNNGKVRVLIGSTGKMGVGMNAQRRMTAIHHLDSPWRPGDVEQRDGRILRQGNLNDEVAKYVYVTEKSFDARMWDILDRKQHFINQIMNGENVGRTAEDTGNVTLSAAEIKALASGNPLIREQVELSNDLQQLQSLQKAHRSSVIAAQVKLLEDAQKISELTGRIENAEKDIKTRKDTYSDGKFSMKVGNSTYTDKKQAGVALATAIVTNANKDGFVDVGTFAGFTLRALKIDGGYTGLVSGAQGYKFNVYPENTTYMINHIIEVVKGLESKLAGYKTVLEETKTDRDAQERLAKEPFSKQKEFNEKTARLNEIMQILNPKDEQTIGDEESDEQYQEREDYDGLEPFEDDGIQYSVRQEAPPKKTRIGYKVFKCVNGQLYPTKVKNPNGAGTPLGIWLNADTGELARNPDGSLILNTLGRISVKADGGTLAWRPGWHLGALPEANQMNITNPNNKDGKKTQVGLMHENYVFCECEFAADVDYQLEAFQMGFTKNGKYTHKLAGLPYLPHNGYYRYRTNPDPNTSPWFISGAIKITKILDDAQRKEIIDQWNAEHPDEPMYYAPRKGGDLSGEDFYNRFGLMSGEVTTPSEVEASPGVDYSEEIKALEGYKPNAINWDNPTFREAFGINKTDKSYEEYRAEYESRQPSEQYQLREPPENVKAIAQAIAAPKVTAGTMLSGGGLVDTGIAAIISSMFAVEKAEKIAAIYTMNHDTAFMGDDVLTFDPTPYAGKLQYLHVSPECKTDSRLITNAAKQRRHDSNIDVRIAQAIANDIEVILPEVFTLENVPGYKGEQGWKIITDTLTRLGYDWDGYVYKTSDYGGPTIRERYLIRAVKDGTLPPVPEQITKGKEIGWYSVVKDLIGTKDCPETTQLNDRMMRNLAERGIDINNLSEPILVFGNSYKSGDFGVSYGSKPALTIFAKSGASRIFTPDGKAYDAKPRVLARIMGLPDSYQLDTDLETARRIVGNGVPVQLTQKVFGNLLTSHYGMDFQYQERNSPLTNREVLAIAAQSVNVDSLNEAERDALGIFRDKLEKLYDLETRRAEEGRTYKEQQFGSKVDREAAKQTLERMHVLDEQIRKSSADVLKVENTEVMKQVLQKARKVVESVERAHGDELLKRYRDRRNNAAAIKKYRDRIKKDVGDLSKWILHPDNKSIYRHVPDAIKNSVIPFLETINFTSKRALKGGENTKGDKAFLENLKKLRNSLKKQIDIEGMYSGYLDLPADFMEELQQFIDDAEKFSQLNGSVFYINRMTSEELKALSKLVRVLKKLIVNMNSFHNNAMFKHTYDAGDNTIKYMADMKDSRGTNAVSDFVLWQQIRPAYAFERFGDGGISIYDEFRRGQSKLAFNTVELKNFAESAYTEAEVKAWEKEIKTFTIENKERKVPVSYLMGLYELCKRPQAKEHIYGNGIRIATYSNGKEKISDTGFLVDIDTLQEMLKVLTPRQIEVADKLQQYMAKKGGEWGNYVSVARFGEEQFGEEHYYPINSDGRHLQATADEAPSKASLYALLNMSFTKDLVEHANNRIVLYSIFDVFANHMSSMAQYNAFALPVLDSLKWLNYKETATTATGETMVVDSVREEMARVYGVPEENRPGSGRRGYAESFVIGIIRAFNGTEAQGVPQDVRFVNGMHRYNMAQVAYNLRVVAQQPLSVVRAGMIIGYDSILKGLKPDELISNAQEAERYSGIAAWKQLGFYDVNISRGMADIVKHDSSIMDKIGDVGMAGAEFADRITWGAMWAACKAEVESKQHIMPSDEKFFPAVTELFEEVIYKTQVVDSVLTKNEFLRSKGSIARYLSSFMSEPTTTASMLIDTYDKYQREIQRGKSMREAWAEHGARIGRLVAVYCLSSFLLAVSTAVIDAFRDDDDYESWGEKFKEKFWGNLADEASPINKLPIMRDVYELTKELLRLFGVDTYGNAPRSVIFQWWDTLLKGVEIIKDRIDKNEKDKYTWYGGIYKLLQAVSGMTGLPAASAMREVVTIWNNTVGAMAPSIKLKTYDPGEKASIKYAFADGYLTEDEAKKALLDTGVAEDENAAYWLVEAWKRGGENTSNYSKVYDAMLKGGNIREAVNEMKAHGYEEKKINSQIKSKIGEWYRGTSGDKVTISESEAVKMLMSYCNLSKADADKTVSAWKEKLKESKSK